MNDPERRPFRDALLVYEEATLPEIGAVSTMDAIRLIEAVDGCLVGGGVLFATQDDLEAALQLVLAQEGNTDSSVFLRAEMDRFLDLAAAHGLAARHPSSGEARVEIVGDKTDLPNRQEITRLMTRLVAKLVEEGLSSALLVSPLAVPVSEVGEEGGALDQAAEHLSKRWRGLTHRLRQPLDVLRIALPATALLLALNSFFSCSGPLGSRTRSAVLTGAGVNQLKALTRDMAGPGIGDPYTIGTLQELSERTGLPTDRASEVFRLKRVLYGVVYLEHLETGKLAVISGEYVGSFGKKGTWRIVK
jgi:hypothetical protein